ncbi:glucosyl-dolichyl phosphate glucuronosyltransferase [Haloplanus halophilus]|uniref:glucosyl-dolichyl phosphate glucuronosyltransferase n=1 Tax=Haloplanus halophilus TaxID=2949993 RepID=UPI00203A5FEB|nr:glucosyl-dolichyl phosphate glucuronosyltransferase [Haloplanus sp. GDY1]
MQVSVVVCTYAMDRYEAFTEAVESALAQTYDPLEVVLVVDGNEAVYERVLEDFGDVENVLTHCNEENHGISYSRTKGAELASGEVVAMIDDDAVAHEDWIAELVSTYEETDAVAVAGDVRPDWQTEKPDFFPAEFYWLVGCVEPGFADDGEEVRNGYGSNISFRRDVFLEAGGYDTHTGRRGDKHIQAHEAPVCIRIRELTGQGVVYTDDAVVDHKLFDYRGEFTWLVARSFWQGYSKRVMSLLYPDEDGDETDYLRFLFLDRVPRRVKGCVTKPSVAAVLQILTIFVFTGAVGLGYLYAFLTPGLLEKVETVEE